MKIPCGHDRVEVYEVGRGGTSHLLEDGKWSHNSDFGDYTGAILIICKRCGKEWRYGPNAKKPKWATALYEASISEDSPQW